MNTRTRLAAAALTAAALLAAGCTDSSQAATPAPPPSVAPSPSPSPSPSPTPSTPNEIAIAQAEQAVRDYYKVSNELARNPDADIDALRAVAVGTGLSDATVEIMQLREAGQRTKGDLELEGMTVTEVDLTNDPKRYPPAIPTVQLEVCYNVSNINLTDADGSPADVSPGRDRAINSVGMANYDWPNADGWKLAYRTSEFEPCGTGQAG